MEFKRNNRLDIDQAKIHRQDFDMEVPDNYFEESKKTILSLTIEKRKKSTKVQLMTVSMIAASLLIAIMLFVGKSDTETFTTIDEKESEVLINALFADDSRLEALTDAYMLEDLYVENDMLN